MPFAMVDPNIGGLFLPTLRTNIGKDDPTQKKYALNTTPAPIAVKTPSSIPAQPEPEPTGESDAWFEGVLAGMPSRQVQEPVEERPISVDYENDPSFQQILAGLPSKQALAATTTLSETEEPAFQQWYRGWAEKTGIDPNPDNALHKYDYRAAFKAGVVPEISPEDGLYHWPSEFKDDDHPNRFVRGVDTKVATPAAQRPKAFAEPTAGQTAEAIESRRQEAARQLATEQDPARRATLQQIVEKNTLPVMEPESAAMSATRSAGGAVAPAAAGLAIGGRATSAVAARAPGAWKLAAFPVGLIAGGGSAAVMGKLQEWLKVQVFGPERYKEMIAQEQANRAAHPVTTGVGELVPSFAAMKPLSLKSWRNINEISKRIVAGLKAGGKAEALKVVSTPAGEQAMRDLFNVGLSGTVDGTQEAIAQVRTGDFDPYRIVLLSVAGSIMADPNRLGRKLMGIKVGPTEQKAVRDAMDTVTNPETEAIWQKAIEDRAKAEEAVPERQVGTLPEQPTPDRGKITVAEPTATESPTTLRDAQIIVLKDKQTRGELTPDEQKQLATLEQPVKAPEAPKPAEGAPVALEQPIAAKTPAPVAPEAAEGIPLGKATIDKTVLQEKLDAGVPMKEAKEAARVKPLTAQAPQKGTTPAVEAPVAEPTRLAEPAKAVPSQEQAGATFQDKAIDDMLFIGDNVRIMGVDSTLTKSEEIDGIRYELFNGSKMKENRAAIRITDIDSGKVSTLKQYPDLDRAETEFTTVVKAVKPVEVPQAAAKLSRSFSVQRERMTKETPLIDRIEAAGGIRPPTKGNRNSPEYGPLIESPLTGKAKKVWGSKNSDGADVVAEREGFASATEMWDAIKQDAKTKRGGEIEDQANARAEYEAKEGLRVESRRRGVNPVKVLEQDEAFRADNVPEKGDEIPARMLDVGEEVVIGGETFKVTKVDPDTGEVELTDGKKYGIQKVDASEMLYVEKVAEPSVADVKVSTGPSGQAEMTMKDEGFRLVGEKGADGEAVVKAKAAKEKAAKEQDARQGKMVLTKSESGDIVLPKKGTEYDNGNFGILQKIQVQNVERSGARWKSFFDEARLRWQRKLDPREPEVSRYRTKRRHEYDLDLATEHSFELAHALFHHLSYDSVPILKDSKWIAFVLPKEKLAFFSKGEGVEEYAILHEYFHAQRASETPAAMQLRDMVDLNHPDIATWRKAIEGSDGKKLSDDALREEIAATFASGENPQAVLVFKDAALAKEARLTFQQEAVRNWQKSVASITGPRISVPEKSLVESLNAGEPTKPPKGATFVEVTDAKGRTSVVGVKDLDTLKDTGITKARWVVKGKKGAKEVDKGKVNYGQSRSPENSVAVQGRETEILPRNERDSDAGIYSQRNEGLLVPVSKAGDDAGVARSKRNIKPRMLTRKALDLAKSLEKSAETAEAESRKRMTEGVDPTILLSLAKRAAAKILRGVARTTKDDDAVAKEYGEEYRPHMDQIYQQAEEIIADATSREVTGFAKAPMTEQLKASGAEVPTSDRAKRSFAVRDAEVDERVAADPDYIKKLVDRVADNPEERVGDTEMHAIERAATDVTNRINEANERGASDAELEPLLREQTHAAKALRHGFSQMGSGLQTAQQTMYEDFTFGGLLRQYESSTGSDAPPPKDVIDVAKRISKEYETKLAERDAQIERQRQENEDLAFRVMEAESKRGKTTRGAKIKQKAKDLDAFHDRLIAEAEKRLGVTTTLGVDPTRIVDLAIVGSGYIKKGAKAFGEWSKPMLEKFGESIKEHLPKIWEKANAFLNEIPKMYDADLEKAKAVGKLRPSKGEAADKAKAGLAIRQLARAVYEMGTRDRNALVLEVERIVKDAGMDMTNREVRDAITGYGEYQKPAQDELSRGLRETRRQLLKISQIEDAYEAKRQKLTGKQRDPQSDEMRELEKIRREAMKELGVEGEEPDAGLKSALDAVRTRLENQIYDLDEAIKTGRPLPEQRAKLEYPPDLKAMQAQRDALKAEYDAIFTKELTDQERLDTAIARAEKSAETAEQNLRQPKAPRTEKPLPPSDRLAELRQRAADAKELAANLKKLTIVKKGKTPEELAAAELERAQTRLNELNFALEQAAEGQFPGAARKLPRVVPPAVVELRQAQKDAAELIANLQKLATAATPAQLKAKALADAIRQAERQAAAWDRKASDAAHGIAPAKRVPKPMPESERIAELQQQVADAKDFVQGLQKIKNAKTPAEMDAIALENFKKRANKRIAEMEEQMQTGEVKKRQPRVLPMDAEAFEAQQRLDETKAKFREFLFKKEQAKRTPVWHVLDILGAPWSAVQQTMVGYDISPVGRQGALAVPAHPILATKALRNAVASMFSERAYQNMMKEQKASPNAKMHDLTDIDTPQQYRSLEQMRLEKFFNKTLRGRVWQRTAAAFYNTFRPALHDAMLKKAEKYGGTVDSQTGEFFKHISNIMTGKSDPTGFEGAERAAGYAAWSPSQLVSRIQYPLMLLRSTGKGTREGLIYKRIIAEEYGRMAAGFLGLYLAGIAAGGEPDTDRRSPTFGSLRFGNTRWNPWGGFTQPWVFIDQMWYGKKVLPTGEEVALRPSVGKVPYGRGALVEMTRFIRGRLRPELGLAVNLFTGVNFRGDRITPLEAVVQSVTPISLQNLTSAIEDQGLTKGAALDILQILGHGIVTYSSAPPLGIRDFIKSHVSTFGEPPSDAEIERQRERIESYTPERRAAWNRGERERKEKNEAYNREIKQRSAQ